MCSRVFLCYPTIVQLLQWADSHPRSPTALFKKLRQWRIPRRKWAVSRQRNYCIDDTGLAVVLQTPNQVSKVPWSSGVWDKSERLREKCVTSGVKFISREWGQSACVFYGDFKCLYVSTYSMWLSVWLYAAKFIAAQKYTRGGRRKCSVPRTRCQ
jgi:hypothetical protein